jgi:cell division septation protein DedD
MSIRAWGLLAGVLALLFTVPAAAQSPALGRVDELARMGRAEEARVELMEWWEGARDDSSQRDLQLGLWLRGRLTVDPSQAELDFQRLVVLYPSSAYTPPALFRLAQASHAQGDAEGARRHVATLVRDYPSSESRTDAEAWLSNAGAPPAATQATATATATRPVRGDATPAVATPPSRPARPAEVPQVWFVQFGAFADEERAFALHQELVGASLAARLVSIEGSAFLHVRIGRFGTREEANAQLQRVDARGYSASIVRDERLETTVRR